MADLVPSNSDSRVVCRCPPAARASLGNRVPILAEIVAGGRVCGLTVMIAKLRRSSVLMSYEKFPRLWLELAVTPLATRFPSDGGDDGAGRSRHGH